MLATIAMMLVVNKVVANEQMAYLAYHVGYWQVWVIEKGKNARPVSASKFDKARISWYPDGKAMLLNGTQGQLSRLDMRSGKEQELNILESSITDAMLSPDGNKIAYSISTGHSRDQNDIWIYDVQSDKKTKLTQMPYLQHEPVWSHDGKVIYFLSGRGKQSHDIWKVNVKTKSTEQVTHNNLYHFDIAANNSGEILFSSNRDGNYEIYRIKSGKVIRETNNSALDGRPSWCQNDKYIYFESTRGSGISNIWRKQLATGQVEQVIKSKIGARYPVCFTGGEQ